MKALLLICLITIIGCGSHKREIAAWQIAEHSATNKTELTQFLDHYKKLGDKDKYRAACFLVANMPNKYSVSTDGRELIYDIDIVKSDSLIQSLEYSFNLRDNSPFLKDYSFEQFCEYILPYRIANEPLEYYWKWDCVKRFGNGNSSDIIEAAKNINGNIKIGISAENYGDPVKSYSSLIELGYGKCDDRTTLVVMALRAVGIPAAFEYIPYWGSSNNGHSFCSAILPDGKIILLQSGIDDTQNILPARKAAKVFRKTYTNYDKNPLYGSDETTPSYLSDPSVVDVTSLHSIGKTNVDIKDIFDSQYKIVYLTLFSPAEWHPIAWATKERNRAIFTAIGTGDRLDGTIIAEAQGLGDGILYLPCFYENNSVIPAAPAMIVSKNNIYRQLIPDTTLRETIVLTRKFPLDNRIADFARNMIGGIFEGANRADFSDAVELYCIADTPLSRMQRVDIDSEKPYSYIRYRRPHGIFSIAELHILDDAGKPIKGRPISCNALSEQEEFKYIYDNDPLSYFDLSGGIDIWTGIKLDRPQKISFVEFCPRNDDNCIRPDDEYELFYWDNNQWISLGVKVADEYNITYEGVPRGALLWLRNLTRGREERPFTYENNRQVWW